MFIFNNLIQENNHLKKAKFNQKKIPEITRVIFKN